MAQKSQPQGWSWKYILVFGDSFWFTAGFCFIQLFMLPQNISIWKLNRIFIRLRRLPRGTIFLKIGLCLMHSCCAFLSSEFNMNSLPFPNALHWNTQELLKCRNIGIRCFILVWASQITKIYLNILIGVIKLQCEIENSTLFVCWNWIYWKKLIISKISCKNQMVVLELLLYRNIIYLSVIHNSRFV